MKTEKLKVNRDFYFFKRKNKSGGYDLNFILYSKRRIEDQDVYVFLKKDESLIEIDYLGQFSLVIGNLSKDFVSLIEQSKEIYITEIDRSKKVKPLSYVGKILK